MSTSISQGHCEVTGLVHRNLAQSRQEVNVSCCFYYYRWTAVPTTVTPDERGAIPWVTGHALPPPHPTPQGSSLV